MPVPETNGEEWDRLEPTTALDALVELVVLGEYPGTSPISSVKEGLQLRAAGISVFEVCHDTLSPALFDLIIET